MAAGKPPLPSWNPVFFLEHGGAGAFLSGLEEQDLATEDSGVVVATSQEQLDGGASKVTFSKDDLENNILQYILEISALKQDHFDEKGVMALKDKLDGLLKKFSSFNFELLSEEDKYRLTTEIENLKSQLDDFEALKSFSFFDNTKTFDQLNNLLEHLKNSPPKRIYSAREIELNERINANFFEIRKLESNRSEKLSCKEEQVKKIRSIQAEIKELEDNLVNVKDDHKEVNAKIQKLNEQIAFAKKLMDQFDIEVEIYRSEIVRISKENEELKGRRFFAIEEAEAHRFQMDLAKAMAESLLDGSKTTALEPGSIRQAPIEKYEDEILRILKDISLNQKTKLSEQDLQRLNERLSYLIIQLPPLNLDVSACTLKRLTIEIMLLKRKLDEFTPLADESHPDYLRSCNDLKQTLTYLQKEKEKKIANLTKKLKDFKTLYDSNLEESNKKKKQIEENSSLIKEKERDIIVQLRVQKSEQETVFFNISESDHTNATYVNQEIVRLQTLIEQEETESSQLKEEIENCKQRIEALSILNVGLLSQIQLIQDEMAYDESISLPDDGGPSATSQDAGAAARFTKKPKLK